MATTDEPQSAPVDSAAIVARLQARITDADELPPDLFADGDLADSLYAALNRLEAARFPMPFVAADTEPAPAAAADPAKTADAAGAGTAGAGAKVKGFARTAAKRVVGPLPGRVLRRVDAFVDELFAFNRSAAERIRTLEARVAELEARLGDTPDSAAQSAGAAEGN